MSTSQKHRNFVCEPMGNKLVTELPGIGSVLAQRLANAGYLKASSVLGQFLAMDKDQEKFKLWLKSVCQANSKQANDCYISMRDWTNNFL
ncbi:barrier-to-autointegration factor-like [Ctenocephalides felis]|uniref:barrier-to-autointegration factor-like n=1 Tax=Ctenocephalides felis TaxID=7515 RepID=UPI000E6E2714|nr:barrier-to-autointegration factor-like [Ctenocephalides felis]